MSFGFSVGDVIAVSRIIQEISGLLNEAKEAKEDYQELLRELESLDNALQKLDRLQQRASTDSKTLDSLKYAALSCRRPLEQFLQKIKKYDDSLGFWSKAGRFKQKSDRLKWVLGKTEGFSKLQGYLNIHIGTINLLMTEYGFEALDLALDRAEDRQSDIHERLDRTRELIAGIDGNITAQTTAVEAAHRMVARLCHTLIGDTTTSWSSLLNMVTKVCISTQQIYTILIDLKYAVTTAPDARWSFFQEPLLIEDALGHKFPVPSEYDFELLNNILKTRFKEGPGSRDVAVGNYEIFLTKDSQQLVTASTRLRPGTHITMAIMISRLKNYGASCPMPRCQSKISTPVPGGGRLCSDCNVWFDDSSRKRRRIEDLFDAVNQLANDGDIARFEADSQERPSKRQRLSEDDDSTVFKNVRCAEDEPDNETLRDLTPQSSQSSIDSFVLSSETVRNRTLNEDMTEGVDEDDVGDKFSDAIEKRTGGPVEFNHAITYVNKIKARYGGNPSVYRRFLETLQAYQRESKPITTVYGEVIRLFEGQPDLIEDFKQFLPESAATAEQDNETRTKVTLLMVDLKNKLSPEAFADLLVLKKNLVEQKVLWPEFLARASVLLPVDVDILKRFFELAPFFKSTPTIDLELEEV